MTNPNIGGMPSDFHSAIAEEGLSWRDYANCLGADPAIFFPEKSGSVLEAKAKEICRGCDVRRECLDYALSNGEEFGIWGGMARRERRRELRRRRALGRTTISSYTR